MHLISISVGSFNVFYLCGLASPCDEYESRATNSMTRFVEVLSENRDFFFSQKRSILPKRCVFGVLVVGLSPCSKNCQSIHVACETQLDVCHRLLKHLTSHCIFYSVSAARAMNGLPIL